MYWREEKEALEIVKKHKTSERNVYDIAEGRIWKEVHDEFFALEENKHLKSKRGKRKTTPWREKRAWNIKYKHRFHNITPKELAKEYKIHERTVNFIISGERHPKVHAEFIQKFGEETFIERLKRMRNERANKIESIEPLAA